MTDLANPIFRRRRLGAELRQLRDGAGLTMKQVAEKLEYSESTISRIETGQVGVHPRVVLDLLKLYKVTGQQRDELIEQARDARQKAWWQVYRDLLQPADAEYIGLEAAADWIRIWELGFVPGLLQTAAYTAAVIRKLHMDFTEDQIERSVALRERRQARLRRNPPTIRAIIDQGALCHPVGGPEVMRQQLQRLAHDSTLSAVTLQVLPSQAPEHAGMYGSFTILGFESPPYPSVVYLETLTESLSLENDEDRSRYMAAFEHLRGSALHPCASKDLLTKLATNL